MWQDEMRTVLGLFLMSPREVLVIVVIALVIAFVIGRRGRMKRRDRDKR
jgi:hypothetical protein